MVNGLTGNFCLSIERDADPATFRSEAWSSNVEHHVVLRGDEVRLYRVTEEHGEPKAISRTEVAAGLSEYYRREIASDPARTRHPIVAHALITFRKLRGVQEVQISDLDALRAFLVLLACSVEGTEIDSVDLQAWGLSPEARDAASSIPKERWRAILSEFRHPVDPAIPAGVAPLTSLVLQHASGEVFQEAHQAIQSPFRGQPSLFRDTSPPPVQPVPGTQPRSVHFTPHALARTLCEETFASFDDWKSRDALTIMDPACGSGEMLREAVRCVGRAGRQPSVRLVGWDVSPSACEMARFTVSWELRTSNLPQAIVEIVNRTSLVEAPEWPASDILVMNPPFVEWGDLGSEERGSVRAILGDRLSGSGRPDLSAVFLLNATNSVGRANGAVGTILPAATFDATYARALRGAIAEDLKPALIGRLGSHSVFRSARVDVGVYVGVAHDAARDEPATAVYADHEKESVTEALKTLRSVRRGIVDLPIRTGGFEIYETDEIGIDGKSWAPRPYHAVELLKSLHDLPRIGEAFNVRQGIRTGSVRTFVLPEDEYRRLPEQERQFFRPAVVNRSFNFGHLIVTDYVFYPHGDGRNIASESDLKAAVPVYYQRVLLPAKSKLQERKRVAKWWLLSEHRAWNVNPRRRFVSKYFGLPGAFAYDSAGELAVVQGFAWTPKKAWRVSLESWEDGWLAYLAILNSRTFFDLVSAQSNHVGGGQWDLSPRFVKQLPFPMLSPDDTNAEALIAVGRQLNSGNLINDSDLVSHWEELVVDSLFSS